MTDNTPEATPEAQRFVIDWTEFLAEFNFKPHPRFLNSVANQPDLDSVSEYVKGYFRIIGHSDAEAMAAKCKEESARGLFARTAALKPSRRMNDRLVIFYSRTTGCDDLAMKEAGLLPDAETVWCDYEDGSDAELEQYFKRTTFGAASKCAKHGHLFRQFAYDKDGKPGFVDTPLSSAMKNGASVIFQHVNLLPLALQQELRGVTDEKTLVSFAGIPETFRIEPGFRIIATMDLFPRGTLIPLSPLLAERAGTIREFEMTAAALAKFLLQ